jgi:hypothetical protein
VHQHNIVGVDRNALILVTQVKNLLTLKLIYLSEPNTSHLHKVFLNILTKFIRGRGAVCEGAEGALCVRGGSASANPCMSGLVGAAASAVQQWRG